VTDLGSVPLTGSGDTASATSPSFPPPAVGTYCFSGVYSGDGNYAMAGAGSTDCFDAVSDATIQTSVLHDSIVLGGTEAATAAVFGSPGAPPSGDVHFYVCPDPSGQCTIESSGLVDLGTETLSDSGNNDIYIASSAPYTPPAVGDYCFLAVYSGNGVYPSVSDGSDAQECFTVTSAPTSVDALGSPENSYGTGNGPGGTPVTGLWAAVNGYCTAEEQGDPFLSAFDGLFTGSGWNCPANPTNSGSTPDYINSEYNGGSGITAGYSYDISTPQDPGGVTTSDIEVDIYDPAYEPSGCAGTPDLPIGSPGSGGTASHITTIYSLYSHPVPGDDTKDVQTGSSVTEPTSAPGTCVTWVPMFTIPAGSPDGQYRLQVTTQAGQSDSSGVNAYGVRVWSTGNGSWTRCSTLPTVAWYSASCPEVSGESALSVWINAGSAGNVAQFYLASIDAAYAGHTLDVNLFDPGEGSHYIQVVDPSGCPVPFSLEATDNASRTAEGFANIAPTGPTSDATVPGSPPAGCPAPAPGVPANPGLDVSGRTSTVANINDNGPPGPNYIYNDRHLQLAVSIPADYTAPAGGWWSIKYIATGSVNDRTTWSVTVGTASDGGTSSTRMAASHRSHATRKHHKKGAVTAHRRLDLGLAG
jgi:hypothetical protein